MRIIHWKVDVRDSRDVGCTVEELALVRSMDNSSVTIGEKVECMDTVASK